MEKDVDLDSAKRGLESARKTLCYVIQDTGEKDQIINYEIGATLPELHRTLNDFELAGTNANCDHNFWHSLANTAQNLGLIGDGERYRIKGDEEWVKRGDIPQSSLGTVCLYTLVQSSLIILAKTGVVYYTQAGGYSCAQRGEEGFLVPLMEPIEYVRGLRQCPLDVDLGYLPWGSFGEIDETIAQKIDVLFQKYYATECLTVDRERLKDSIEAWVYVNIDLLKFRSGVHLKSNKAVLVFTNSD